MTFPLVGNGPGNTLFNAAGASNAGGAPDAASDRYSPNTTIGGDVRPYGPPPGTVPPVPRPAAAPNAFPTTPTGHFTPPVNPAPRSWPEDPGAPVMTAAGMLRQQDPTNGSLFTSLSNGVVLSIYMNGNAQLFDSRSTNPLPQAAPPVPVTTQAGPETRYEGTDALGNVYRFFSKSLDFSVTSPMTAQGWVQQFVYPDGQIVNDCHLVDGTVRRVTLQPNAAVDSDTPVKLGADRITFGDGPEIRLPYQVPVNQALMGTMANLSFGAMALGPVSGMFPRPDPNAHNAIPSPLSIMGFGPGAGQDPFGSLARTAAAAANSMSLMPFNGAIFATRPRSW